MPPTTGGSTSGSRISGRIHRTTRESLRANTMAIGTPSTMHSAVLAAAVLRLSSSAVNDDVLVISDQKLRPVHPRRDGDQRKDDEDRPDGGGHVEPARKSGRADQGRARPARERAPSPARPG